MLLVGTSKIVIRNFIVLEELTADCMSNEVLLGALENCTHVTLNNKRTMYLIEKYETQYGILSIHVLNSDLQTSTILLHDSIPRE